MNATAAAAIPNHVVVFVASCAVIAAGASTAGRRLTGAPRRVPTTDVPTTASPATRCVPGSTVAWRRAGATTVVLGTALLGAFIIGPIAIVGLGVSVWMLRRLLPLRADRRRRSIIERELPATTDLLVLSVRAGLTPQQAVSELASAVPGPIGEAFVEVVRRTQRGQPFADALDALGELLGPQAGALADVIATSDRHGLALGPTLDQLSLEAAGARQRLAEADARRLPVRLSFPLVVCTLPSFVLLAIVPALIAALSSLGRPAW